MTMGERVRELRLAKGWSQADLANQIGVSQQAINNLEKDKTNKSRHIYDLANALETTVEDLRGGTYGHKGPPAAAKRPYDEAPMPSFGAMPRDVPVLGQVVGGDDDEADFEFNGQTIDYIRRPAGIAMMRDVFGLYTTGSSMWPRFEEGEPVYVSAARPPAIGDYVVIELHPTQEGQNGKGYVKRLKKRTANKIVCEQFNPPKEIEFERDKVKSVFRIIPLVELVGV